MTKNFDTLTSLPHRIKGLNGMSLTSEPATVDMIQFIIKSIGQRIVLLFFISIISHAIVHLAPGEPSLVDPSNPRMKAEDIQRIRTAFHLDEPLHMLNTFIG